MKKGNIFLALTGAILPLFALTTSLCPINKADAIEEKKNFNGAKAVLFDNRYSNQDLMNEPLNKKTYEYNFAHMNFGGTNPLTSFIWESERGKPVDETKKTTVAIIDSGIDIYHEDFLTPNAKGVVLNGDNIEQYSTLDPKSAHIYDSTKQGFYTTDVVIEQGIKAAYDDETKFVDGEGNVEYYSHGTACASCVGARVNGVGGWGVAPEVNIMSIRIDLLFNSLDVAIRYAADNGADVISMSLGAYTENFTDGFGDMQEGEPVVATCLQDACDYAYSKDCVIVAAAGNELTDHKSYPACNKGVIGVGALGDRIGNDAAIFSNFNKPTDDPTTENNVDVMAPGYVYTANVPQHKPRGHQVGSVADNFYSVTQGTSFSCPLTAGTIALYRAKYPNATREDVIEALNTSCKDMGDTGWDAKFGFGRVDVENFLTDPIPVTKVEVEPSQLKLTRTNENPFPSYQLNVSFLPLDATPSFKRGLWFTEDSKVATVNEDTGLLKVKGNGKTRIFYITEKDMLEGICELTVEGDVDLIETSGSFTILPSSHSFKSLYDWQGWEIDGVKGESFVYGRNKKRLQFNNNQISYYSYNKNEVPGDITSITMKGSESDWQIFTSDKPFGRVNGMPRKGNDRGIKTINETGITFEIDGNDSYFAICYVGSGAAYIDAIEVNYHSLEIAPKYTLDNISLSGDIPAKVPYKGQLDTSKIKVFANYTNNHPSKEVVGTFSKLDTDSIGRKPVTVTYIENNITKQTTFYVMVTNENATRELETYVGGVNATITNKDNVFKTPTGTITGEDNTTWNLHINKKGNQDIYFGWDGNNKGSQIGSKNGVPTEINISSSSFNKKLIEKVEFKGKCLDADLAIKVGETNLMIDNKPTAKLTNDVRTFTFIGKAQGDINISITNISKFAVICSIRVFEKDGSFYTWTGDEQALSFINYLKTFNTCASDWENREDIKTLVNEFNTMVNDAKSSKLLKETYDDKGYLVSPIEKLIAIVNQYNQTRTKNEETLKLILKSDESGNPTLMYETPDHNLAMTSELSIILFATFAALLLVGGSIIGVIALKRKNH